MLCGTSELVPFPAPNNFEALPIWELASVPSAWSYAAYGRQRCRLEPICTNLANDQLTLANDREGHDFSRAN